jgi:hypothetical protein
MFSDRLKVQMEVARDHPEFVLIGTAYALLTPFGHIFERVLNCPSREVDSLRLGRDRFFANPSTIFKRKVALEVGCIESTFTMDDIPLWFRLLTRGKGWEIAEPLHIYRLQPNSLSKSIECYRQGLLARRKYAPETLGYWPATQESACSGSGWFEIAGLELLSGNGAVVRQAANFLEPESPRAAQRFRWASRIGRVGYACYRWRYPTRHQYRYRPDWEKLFAPLLNGSTVLSQKHSVPATGS